MENRVVHISFTSIDFNCPYCNKKHYDEDDKWLDRLQKNKQGWTRVPCAKCGKRFGVTTGMKGLVSFAISEEKRPCDCWLEVGRCYCAPDATDKEPEPQMEI